MTHIVALLKSHTPFDDDEERDALIDSVYDIAQHFIFQYDFSTVNNQDDVNWGCTDNWAKPHRMLLCVEMLITLRGPKCHTLKVDERCLIRS
jgi:hypothetical protein